MSRIARVPAGRRLETAAVALGTVLFVGVANAHSALGNAPDANSASSATVAAVIVIALVGYGRGLAGVWRRTTRGRREALLRALAFAGGLAAVAMALLSPIDRLGAQLFAIHMIQHELLMLIAAPLLVIGRPLPLFLWALTQDLRAKAARFALSRPLQAMWTVLLSPIVAWLLHALALWVWHVPQFFDAALRNAAVHDAQHLTFLLAALVFWAAMIETRNREQQGAALIYLFTTTVHTSVLGALITFATQPWYGAYLNTPASWGLTALEDQQLGGLIMWVPGSLVYVGVALALLLRWIRASDATATL